MRMTATSSREVKVLKASSMVDTEVSAPGRA